MSGNEAKFLATKFSIHRDPAAWDGHDSEHGARECQVGHKVLSLNVRELEFGNAEITPVQDYIQVGEPHLDAEGARGFPLKFNHRLDHRIVLTASFQRLKKRLKRIVGNGVRVSEQRTGAPNAYFLQSDKIGLSGGNFVSYRRATFRNVAGLNLEIGISNLRRKLR